MALALRPNRALGKLDEFISHNDKLFKCLVVAKLSICCKVCKFEFANGHIRPPVLALLLDSVLGLGFGLEGIALALKTKFVSLALRIMALPWRLRLSHS